MGRTHLLPKLEVGETHLLPIYKVEVGGTGNNHLPIHTPSTSAVTVEIPQKSQRIHWVEKSRENQRRRLTASRATFLSKARQELSVQLQLQAAAFHTLANVDLVSHRFNLDSMGPSRGPVTAVVSKCNKKSLSTSRTPRSVSTEDTRSKSESSPDLNEKVSRRGVTDTPDRLPAEHPDSAKLAQICDSSESHVSDSSPSHIHHQEDDSGLENDLFLSHVDGEGKASMVGVGAKRDTLRAAEAEGRIMIGATAAKLVAENGMKKGDVLSVSQLAGGMGAKATSSLIPLCHPLLITNITVNLTLDVEQAAVVVKTR